MLRSYNSSEFAKILGISKSSLIAKERQGLLPRPARMTRGKIKYRVYYDKDIEVFRKLLDAPRRIIRRRIQAFLNCQHSSGKTSIAANYIEYISNKGIKCLAIDLDQKGDLTAFLGNDTYKRSPTIGQVLLVGGSINGATIRINNFLDLIPGNILLAPAIIQLNSCKANEFLLLNTLRKDICKYDLIVIDTGSNPDILMKNAVLAADDILIPIVDGNMEEASAITLDLIAQLEAEYIGIRKKNKYIFLNKVMNRSGNSNLVDRIKGRFTQQGCSLLKPLKYDVRFEAACKRFQTTVSIHPRSGITREIRELVESAAFIGT